jgi:hypothetical protein
MEKAVVRLGQPLADNVVFQVAVVASRHRMMTGLCVGIQVPLHDMAVGAIDRLIDQISPTFAVSERE